MATLCFASPLTPVLLLVGVLWIEVHASSGWSYTDSHTNPSQWYKTNKMCGGLHQSPIDIVRAKTLYRAELKAIRLILKEGTSLDNLKYTVENNGHSLQITFPKETWFISFLDNDVQQYEVVQLHFHWGSSNEVGSEHFLDGKQYAVEGHLVSFNRNFYSTFDEAKGASDGLAVLGFVGEATSDDDSSSDTMFGVLGDTTKVLSSLVEAKSSREISGFDLRKLLGLVNADSYYRYAGSLTTPPCTQNVMWSVFKKPVMAETKHLELLRELKFGEAEGDKKMVDNFRPTQPLNTENTLVFRVVYRSSTTVLSENPVVIFLTVSLLTVIKRYL